MIDQIVKWFRDFFDLDLMDEIEATAAEYRALYPATTTPSASVVPYDDAGVYYFYAEPGRPSDRLTKVASKATAKGTYRFDTSGKYFFSKKEIGSAVVIIFSDHGKLKRVTVTIK